MANLIKTDNIKCEFLKWNTWFGKQFDCFLKSNSIPKYLLKEKIKFLRNNRYTKDPYTNIHSQFIHRGKEKKKKGKQSKFPSPSE